MGILLPNKLIKNAILNTFWLFFLSCKSALKFFGRDNKADGQCGNNNTKIQWFCCEKFSQWEEDGKNRKFENYKTIIVSNSQRVELWDYGTVRNNSAVAILDASIRPSPRQSSFTKPNKSYTNDFISCHSENIAAKKKKKSTVCDVYVCWLDLGVYGYHRNQHHESQGLKHTRNTENDWTLPLDPPDQHISAPYRLDLPPITLLPRREGASPWELGRDAKMATPAFHWWGGGLFGQKKSKSSWSQSSTQKPHIRLWKKLFLALCSTLHNGYLFWHSFCANFIHFFVIFANFHCLYSCWGIEIFWVVLNGGYYFR